HFIKLMGRSASHIALECALLTQPNVCLISEEVAADKMTLAEVVDSVANAIAARASAGKNFGVALIPEGLIEFIPEVGALITELNTIIARDAAEFSRFSSLEEQSEWIITKLDANSAEVFSTLPRDIKSQLLLDRDPHGNVQVSRIETEKLVIEMVENRLARMKEAGEFTGRFSALAHFFGYEGRCAFPSNFDADYCYSLGFTAFLLIANGLTGYLSSIRNLAHSADKWTAGGVPLTMMMNMERRHGHKKPVIRKALVELDGVPFKTFAAARAAWGVETSYVYPGAIQYFGPAAVADAPSVTIRLEHGVRV
ncbi:MAG: diphosphate--fructose-6-phosphate 1-phosphotransferase, partial [Spirochaetaceae bacterium]